MDIEALFENVHSPSQVIGRLLQIELLQRDGSLRLTEDECDELIDRVIEICHKHGIDIDVTFEDEYEQDLCD